MRFFNEPQVIHNCSRLAWAVVLFLGSVTSLTTSVRKIGISVPRFVFFIKPIRCWRGKNIEMKKIRLFLASIFMILFAFSCGARVNTTETEEIDSLSEEYAEDYSAEDWNPSVLRAVRNGKFGWVSAKDTNKVVIPFEYDSIAMLSIGHEGVTIIDWYIMSAKEYDNGVIFNDYGSEYPDRGYFIVAKNGRWSKIDEHGNVIISEEYNFSFAGGGLEDCWILIEKDGKIGTDEIPCEYDDVDYSHGIYLLKKNGKWGVMKNGVCSEFTYDSITPIFYSVEHGESLPDEEVFTGFYYIYKNGKKNIMASDMKPILNSEIVSYKLVPEDNNFYETVLLVKNKNNYWGIINGEGKQIVPCKYDKIKPLAEEGLFELVKGKKRTKVNAEGEPWE